MKNDNLTVEIFRDMDRRDISVDAAGMGIDHVRRVTTGIEIVRASRLLRIAQPEKSMVRPDKIRWRAFEADMNIILTDRPLYGSDDNLHHGVSYAQRGLGARRVAIVDIANPEYPDLTVAHEAGHLLKLKSEGKTWDKNGHCIDKKCIMYPYEYTDEDDDLVKQKGINLWLERRGYRPAVYEKVKRPGATRYCDECAHQLDATAFFLKLAKSGIPVSHDRL